MRQIIGHDEELQHLLSLDAHKAQSLLLEGCVGIGKKTIAKMLAAQILGVEEVNEAHPDFFLLEKTVDKKTGKEKAEISVEDARKLAKFLSFTPAQSDYRVAILDSADKLGSGAANSILKIVEEPPRNAVIILLAHEGRVLPTIRSRCQRIYFRTLNKENMRVVMAQDFPNLSAEDRDILTEISGGSPGIAHEVYEHNGLDIIRNLAEIMANPQKANYERINSFATKAKKTGKEWHIFKLLISWLLSKLARASLQGQALQLGESQIKAKDALGLASIASALNEKIAECEEYNMDKKVLIVNAVSDILRVPSAAI
jgi:DNA polymerase-3 subunit delta'